MLNARRRFLFFGEYRVSEFVCDACKEPINPDSEFVGEFNFSPEFGVQNEGPHYHSDCIARLDGEAKLMTHSRSFLDKFALDEWHRFAEGVSPDEELRVLHGFFLDSRSGLLKRVIQCGDCGLVAVLNLPPNRSEAQPEVIFYKRDSPKMLSEAPACSSNLQRKSRWRGRLSPEECTHAFVRLGQSGEGTADYMAIREQKISALESGEIDPDWMRFFRINGADVIQGAYEDALGYTWDWCSKCGLVVRLINRPESHLPVSGYETREHGKASYGERSVTLTRPIGAAECRIDS